MGLCFICVGIGATHMMSLGYLYSYATLVGVWNLLAVAHTLIVCDLITIPPEAIDPVLLLGQKIVDGESNTLKIAVPVIYGIQACSWLFSLICLVGLRVGSGSDLTQGFEIQDPKRVSVTHSLEDAQYNREGQRRSKRSSHSFMGFRQSVVAPLDTHPNNGIGMSSGQQRQKHAQQINQYTEQGYGAYEMQEPEKTWVTGERRSSQDSNIIVFPKDRRISQVVLTFKDEIDKESDATLASLAKSAPAAINENVLEARTVLITNHQYELGNMLFDQPGESLSDMIFKAVDMTTSKENYKSIYNNEATTRASHDSEQTDLDTRTESPTFEFAPKSPTLSSTTTLDEFGAAEQDDEYENTMGEILFTSSKESSVNHSSAFDDSYPQTSQISCMKWASHQQVLNTTALSLKYPNHVPMVPERRSSVNHSIQPTCCPTYSDDESDSDLCHHHDPFVSPTMQPNSPDAHPYSNDYSCSISPALAESSSSHVQSSSHPTRSKSSLTSIPLQYWRNHSNSNNPTEESGSFGSFSNTPFNLASTFLKKKHQSPTPPLLNSSPHPTFIIPTIVLHPDEEDGEPARVLSDMDIEYLSTMPPAPLRPLIPAWGEGDEDEYYDNDINEGYDYDDYHQGYDQVYDDEDLEDECDEIMDEDEQDMNTKMSFNSMVGKEVSIASATSGVIARLEQPGTRPEVEYDPYALDVPIHLEIDLQGLEQGDITGYGYI
ncbi:hypothetical protein FBU30_009948 [Linnemannia zychae]|nr:hypothetical protein FBU30_009948 [Linnemannia zychae]